MGGARRTDDVAETKSKKHLPSSEAVRHKDILSPEEMATVLGCCRTTVYSMLRQNLVPSFTVGRLRRVRRTDVDAYVGQQLAASQKILPRGSAN